MSPSQRNPDPPAFTALLNAYARWQNFEQNSAQGTLSPGNVPGYNEHANLATTILLPLTEESSSPNLHTFQTIEGIQQRLNLIDWFDGARGRQPVGAEREETAGLKAELVERRLGEAIEELEVDQFKAETLTQSQINARKIDAAVQCARLQELQQFGHRLTTIKAVANSMEGHRPISTLQARLQSMTERFASD